MPAAARVTDMHTCPMQTPAVPAPIPHVGGPILPPGKPTVLIGKLPAATVGNQCVCAAPAPDMILAGSSSVMIGGLPAARQGDPTVHGGTIAAGLPTVMIGG
ncbi:PAAR domain-containing protein [Streptomyces sp. NPDC059193]|uniref:PAAR domain-containing protein n=1 Tax=Streptomyces sp. NPDC059193 TaxID=3346763 RepID=UPI00368FB163